MHMPCPCHAVACVSRAQYRLPPMSLACHNVPLWALPKAEPTGASQRHGKDMGRTWQTHANTWQGHGNSMRIRCSWASALCSSAGMLVSLKTLKDFRASRRQRRRKQSLTDLTRRVLRRTYDYHGATLGMLSVNDSLDNSQQLVWPHSVASELNNALSDV